MTFMETHHRRPSKYKPEERKMLNWFKSTKKKIAKGDYPEGRLDKFTHLLEIDAQYRRKNQYE